MTSPGRPTDDELRTALAGTVSDPAVIEMFIAALQADENDEAVYGWMAEETERGIDAGVVSGGGAIGLEPAEGHPRQGERATQG